MEKTFEVINTKIQQINEQHAAATNPLTVVSALANTSQRIASAAVEIANATDDQSQKLQVLAKCVQDLVALNTNAIEQVKTVGLQRAFQVQVLNDLLGSLSELNQAAQQAAQQPEESDEKEDEEVVEEIEQEEELPESL